LHEFVEGRLGVQKLLLDEFGEGTGVDADPEFDVVVFGAEAEVGAGDD